MAEWRKIKEINMSEMWWCLMESERNFHQESEVIHEATPREEK